jgi:RNA polymerase primary sigma factor
VKSRGEGNPFNDDFVQDYVRETWRADYFDGNEELPGLDRIIIESAGMHFVAYDAFGNEIYEENEDDFDEYSDDDADEFASSDDDYIIVDEEEDLDDDETYESRVLARLYGPMHQWQRAAIQAWEDNDHVGIIEAVTGSGKTLLGILAAAKAIDDGFGAVVVVPTRVLQEQWIAELNYYLAKDEDDKAKVVGGLGGEYGTNLRSRATKPGPGRVVVTVAATFSAKSFFHPLTSEPMLLVADEVHRYSGEHHSQIFQDNFERRLGLTATFEPALGRYSLYERYFDESPLFSYSFKEAIQDDDVAEYDLVLVRVVLPTNIKFEYDRLWSRSRAIEDKLRFSAQVSFNPEKVHRELSELKEQGLYLNLIAEWEAVNEEIDKLLSNKATKEASIKLLAPFIQAWGHTVVFTDYLDLAEQLQTILTINGVYSRLLNYQVKQRDREEIFTHFEQGRVRSLVAPKVLDEGVNLPMLSFGIFAGVRRRRLQLVQRLGRILRKNPGKTWPLVCIPVNIGTLEDPKLEGNEALPYSPLSIILANASLVKIVDAVDEDQVKEVFNWYNGSENG